MRILHTSDWHLGNRWKELSREDEFAAYLDWLLQVMRERAVDALLISGDIFDTSSPSDGTLKMFHDFLSKADETGCRAIIMTGGNHDGVAQLEATAPLLERYHACLISHLKPDAVQDCLIELKDANGKVAALVCAVPFLRVRDVSVCVEGDAVQMSYVRGVEAVYRSVAELAAEWKQAHPGMPVVAMGHLAVGGAPATDSTRALIGYVDCVDAEVFASVFDYVALGHIHKGYSLQDGRIRYCGSPLPMGIDETQLPHRVVLVEADGSTLKHESIEVPVFVAYAARTCANPAELDALADELSTLAGNASTPTLCLECTYTGTDMSLNELKRYTADWGAKPFMKHFKPMLACSAGMLSIDNGREDELSAYDPERIFEYKLQSEFADMPASKQETMRAMFREILTQLN